MKDVQTLPGADTDSDHNLLVAKICTRLKKIIRFQKRRPQRDLEKLYTQKQRVQDILGGKLGAIGCDSGNIEVQWNNIKECVLDTLSDLVEKVCRSICSCITDSHLYKITSTKCRINTVVPPDDGPGEVRNM